MRREILGGNKLTIYEAKDVVPYLEILEKIRTYSTRCGNKFSCMIQFNREGNTCISYSIYKES